MHHLFRLYLIFITLCFQNAFAQKWDNNWHMGYSCCQTLYGGMDVNFDSASPLITSVNFGMAFYLTNATMSDTIGNLIFYTNGFYIANANDDTMLNGSGINPGTFANGYSQTGEPEAQGDIVIPAPGNNDIYYLFHVIGDGANVTAEPSRLYYSIIDMTLDGGLGGVYSKNNILFYDTLSHGGIAACKHANGRDWWIVIPKHNSNQYYIILLTPFGIQYSVQNIGPIFSQDLAGQNVFSPDGQWYCRYESIDGMLLMNFDRCSGTFYNPLYLPESQINDSAFCVGAAFSLSSQRLYLSSTYHIYQFDLSASQILNTKTTVALYDSFPTTLITNFYLAQLARNGKIYITSCNGSLYYHVINAPDSLGITCDVLQHSVNLPRYNFASISYFPYYYLGAQRNSICDSLITEVSNDFSLGNLISIFPNPYSTYFHLTSRLETNQEITVKLFDIQANQVYETKAHLHNQDFNIPYIEPGVYFLEISGLKDIVRIKIVKL